MVHIPSEYEDDEILSPKPGVVRDTSQYMQCARAPTTTARTVTAVRAAFIPGATVLLDQTTEISMVAAISIVNHIAEAFPCPFTQSAIRSWLNAMRMNGMDTAPEMLTIQDLVLSGIIFHRGRGLYTYISEQNLEVACRFH